ncbi:phosphotransferase enzyme family protein [Phytohabitans rumicis]|uniref:phosphotransferase enzyme family protein n=1 Tax=Phytohabitans rumicis TaxID=1076125 RepID=UPI001FE255CA|nr:phosphotransferase [Phytohabitans rumicis]
MAFVDPVGATIRAVWHRTPDEITPLSGGLHGRAWLVRAEGERYVAKLAPLADRPQFEAGLAAADFLRHRGVLAGTPVRTADGALTAVVDEGVLALLYGVPGRPLEGDDPLDQQWWGDLLGRVHRKLDGFTHPGLAPWHWLRADANHLGVEPWLRPAVCAAVAAMTKLCVTDRLTYGVLHGDPHPRAFAIDADTGRSGLADWGAAAAGPLAYDVASAVLYAGGLPAAAELLDGYAAAGPVPADELHAALPVMVRFRWAARADWHARQLAEGDESHHAGLRAAQEALTTG